MKRILAAVLLLTLAAPALGQDYEKGVRAFGQRDYATALREWRPLAEQGDTAAQFALGLMYENGRGVPQDYAEALSWYGLAAEQGNAVAQAGLASMYYKGQAVSQDYVQAHKWFNLAASRLPAGEIRDMAAENRDIVAAKMTPAQIAEAQRLASEWKPK